MNKIDLILIFKAMLMVAREYDLEIDEKYQELENNLLEEYELDAGDIMGSLEKVYQELK